MVRSVVVFISSNMTPANTLSGCAFETISNLTLQQLRQWHIRLGHFGGFRKDVPFLAQEM